MDKIDLFITNPIIYPEYPYIWIFVFGDTKAIKWLAVYQQMLTVDVDRPYTEWLSINIRAVCHLPWIIE